MVTAKVKHKRNKGLTLVLLPALIFMFLVGWYIYWTGNDRKVNHENRKPTQQDKPSEGNVTVFAVLDGEKQGILNE